jgi:hypothetical protein
VEAVTQTLAELSGMHPDDQARAAAVAQRALISRLVAQQRGACFG